MGFGLNFGIGLLGSMNNNFQDARARRQELVDARMSNLYREKQLYDMKKMKGEEERLKAQAALSQLQGMYPEHNLTLNDAYSFQKSGQLNDILDGKQKIKGVTGEGKTADVMQQTQDAFAPDPRDRAAKTFSQAFKTALTGGEPTGIDQQANALFQSSTGMSDKELQMMRLGYASDLDLPTDRTYQIERNISGQGGYGSASERDRARYVELSEKARTGQLSTADKTEFDYLQLKISRMVTGADNTTSIMTPQTLGATPMGAPAQDGQFASIYDAIEQVESGGNPNAVSPKGAVGPMQTMPGTLTAPGYGVQPASNPNDPNEQSRVGRDYYDAMLREFGNPTDALVAYNWGPDNAMKWVQGGRDPSKLPAETFDYVGKVTRLMQGQQQGFASRPAAPQAASAQQAAPSGDPYLDPVNRTPDGKSALKKAGTWALDRGVPQKIPEAIEEAMVGGHNALAAIEAMVNNFDKSGWVKGGQITGEALKSRIGKWLDTDTAAAEWSAAEDKARTAIQGLIKGTPSNYDASLFEKTVPNIDTNPTENLFRMKEFMREANLIVRNNIDYMHQQRMQVNPTHYDLADKLANEIKTIDGMIAEAKQAEKVRNTPKPEDKPKAKAAPPQEQTNAAPKQAELPSFESTDDPAIDELPKGTMFMYQGKKYRKD